MKTEVFPCYVCKVPVDPNDPTNYKMIVGFSRKRSGGGVNQIRLSKWGEKYAHDKCVKAESAARRQRK